MLKNAAGVFVLAVAVLASVACSACGSAPEATDAQIRTEVATSLDAANIKGVQVSVIDGQVTVLGNVQDQATADKVASLAAAAKGAKGVTNQLVVTGAGSGNGGPGPDVPIPMQDPNAPDGKIAAKVNLRLLASADLAGSKIVPSATTAGVVTLTGTVPSDAAKASAEKVAKSVDGVTSVVNQLQVVQPTTPAVTVPDPQLTDQINELLDKSFSDLTLFVSVSGGNVTLNGAVPDRNVILKVSNAIHAVPGVKGVDTSHLTVQGNTEGSDTIGSPSKKTP